MQNFLEKFPKLTELSKNGSSFLITLLSTTKGYEYLTTVNNFTIGELERWR